MNRKVLEITKNLANAQAETASAALPVPPPTAAEEPAADGTQGLDTMWSTFGAGDSSVAHPLASVADAALAAGLAAQLVKDIAFLLQAGSDEPTETVNYHEFHVLLCGQAEDVTNFEETMDKWVETTKRDVRSPLTVQAGEYLLSLDDGALLTELAAWQDARAPEPAAAAAAAAAADVQEEAVAIDGLAALWIKFGNGEEATQSKLDELQAAATEVELEVADIVWLLHQQDAAAANDEPIAFFKFFSLLCGQSDGVSDFVGTMDKWVGTTSLGVRNTLTALAGESLLSLDDEADSSELAVWQDLRDPPVGVDESTAVPTVEEPESPKKQLQRNEPEIAPLSPELNDPSGIMLLRMMTYAALHSDSPEEALTQEELAMEFSIKILVEKLPSILEEMDSQGVVISRLDGDGDGSVSAAEIITALDQDGNGAITVAEFLKSMGTLMKNHWRVVRRPSEVVAAVAPDSVAEDASEKAAEAAVAADPLADKLAKIAAIKTSHPDNRAIKHFDLEYFDSLATDEEKAGLLQCVNSGLENADSGMGCYAMQPSDYDRFKPFFSKVLADYHTVAEDAKHVNNWSLEGVEGLPEGGKLDLAALGLPKLSMRVRVGRNLKEFPLPGAMTSEDRVNMETKMCAAFEKLKAMPEFGGGYNSLTPGHENFIDETAYQALIDEHIMFKDMAADTYLAAAGIASDWPHGRGCYVSEDRGFVIWVGEEDHLRIMCMKKASILNEVFDRLKAAIDVVNAIEGLEFAQSGDYGVVTSCPTNLGTGMRASVHIPIPNLTADGTDKKAKEICKPLGLSVRGTGGEHTPIGADGTCDISPSARFCISEAQIITALYNGLKLLKEEEAKAGPGAEDVAPSQAASAAGVEVAPATEVAPAGEDAPTTEAETPSLKETPAAETGADEGAPAAEVESTAEAEAAPDA